MKMDNGNFWFVPRESMSSVVELKKNTNLQRISYYHFMNFEDEILYFLAEGQMMGVLSIGDLERFYRGESSELAINSNFIYEKEIDFIVAEQFFKDRKTITEIPIIQKDNKLLGIIKCKKEEALRARQKKTLKYAFKNYWYRDTIWNFVGSTKAKVFFYTLSGRKIMDLLGEEENEIINARQLNKDVSKWRGLSDKEWNIYMDSESEEWMAETMRTEMGACIPNIIKGIGKYPDMQGKCHNIENGYRVTPNNPTDANRRIVMFGACMVIGSYCKDDQTVEYYLQDCLSENNYTAWKVLNRGMFGSEYCYNLMFAEELSEDDIVIIWCLDDQKPKRCMDRLVFQGDLTEVFSNTQLSADKFADSVWHFNYEMNNKIAKRIYSDIYATRALDSALIACKREKLQDYYIGWDIREYFIEYFEKYELNKEVESMNAGAFVLTCNSMTYEYKRSVEEALKIVDKVYLFIVEDSNLQTGLKDRLKMIKAVVQDFPRVMVIPAGKYIFSSKLSRSIRKGYIDKNAAEWDCDIWGEVVSKELGIGYRFIINEFNSQALNEYHEIVRQTLSGFGVEVIDLTVHG